MLADTDTKEVVVGLGNKLNAAQIFDHRSMLTNICTFQISNSQ